jgi:predicted CXXCH cytochrome family protein
VSAFWPLILLGLSLGLLAPLGYFLGRGRGAAAAILVVGLLGGGWWWLAVVGGDWWWFAALDRADAPADWAAVASAPSETCRKCHPDHYESWRRTYHRTMTREATPPYVKGDFEDASYDYRGLRTRLFRAGDRFVMETVDPDWALLRARAGTDGRGLPPPRYKQLTVDRLVGSHWLQECLHRADDGRYVRLPVLYHIGEKRWVHSHGAFLAPPTEDFWGNSRGFTWNDTCLYCHNTGPSKNPVPGPRGEVAGYRTEVAELGISCEACHGPAGEHVRRNGNPVRRIALSQAGMGDASIVHPERLPVARRDEICARCHGAIWPKAPRWDLRTMRDPFVPGQPLERFNSFYWSEEELAELSGRRPAAKKAPGPDDGRFWGDGTPLTTALEYNGMALSACYQKGNGRLSCLACHRMHTDDPNFLLAPGMRTNEACLQCHEGYRDRLTAHTRHAASSPGSECVNCHMPFQVYSLMTVHRSHRIQNPEIEDSLGTGKPHACNLCHLDKSLGWTRDQLTKRPTRKPRNPPKLTADEEAVSSALLLLARGDARTRVVVAGAFANPAARRASGHDWFGLFLPRLMQRERYPVVNYLLHRGLLAAHQETAAGPFDYLAPPARRAEQLRALQARFASRPVRRKLPHLPLTREGLPDERELLRLLEKRCDPDLAIHE